MPCLDCLNDEKIIILAPNCGDDCPEYVGCDDNINANCVTVTPALPCIGTAANTPLTEVLQATDAKLCQSSSNLNACKVKVSASDECCDYLGNKVDVAGGLIKKIEVDESNETCKLLTIKHPEWSYNDISLLPSVFQFVPGNTIQVDGEFPFSRPQAGAYLGGQNGNSFVHEVKLRGAIVSQAYILTALSGSVPSYFPETIVGNINNINKRPTTIKYFSGNYIAENTKLYSYNITIKINGDISLKIVSNNPSDNRTPIVISLDGINYSI